MTDSTPSARTEPTVPEGSAADGSAPALDDRVAVLTDRRGALKLAGVVVGAGALAACSSPPVPSAGGGAAGGGGAGGGAAGGGAAGGGGAGGGGAGGRAPPAAPPPHVPGGGGEGLSH